MSTTQRSWLDKGATRHHYRMKKDGSLWTVQNEYQRVTCPHCGEELFCRLTHIWRHNDEHHNDEHHNNYDKDLVKLKELLITYADENKKIPITEREVSGKQVLVKGTEEIIGEEVQ